LVGAVKGVEVGVAVVPFELFVVFLFFIFKLFWLDLVLKDEVMEEVFEDLIQFLMRHHYKRGLGWQSSSLHIIHGTVTARSICCCSFSRCSY
jgi:hypothetical protein